MSDQLALLDINRFDLSLEERLQRRQSIVDAAGGFVLVYNPRTETHAVHAMTSMGTMGMVVHKVVEISEAELDEFAARVVQHWPDAVARTWDELSPKLQRLVGESAAMPPRTSRVQTEVSDTVGFIAPPPVMRILS